MKEQKIAAIKLVSGEEIICNLLQLEKDGQYTILTFENPLKISFRDRRRTKKYTLEPWLCLNNNSLHCIEVSKIITVHEVTDLDIIEEYKSNFRKKIDLKPKPNRLNKNTNKVGYVGNTEEFKSVLEKIYKDVKSYEKPTEDV